jgi:hypothetical protein
MRMNRLLSWMVVAAVLAPEGQAPSPADGVIRLDFLARDRAGQPVAGLSPEEVTLKVGGRARPLLSLEHVGATGGPRDVALLVDEPTLFGLEPVVRDGITALLASLAPGDRVSYFNTRRPGDVSRQPGHGAVLQALEGMQTGPGDLWSCMPDMLRAIENLARLLPPGRSSTLIVLTRGARDEDAPVSGPSNGCAPGRDALRQTQQVIASTQITIVFVAVNHLTRSWGLDTIAANTGGEAGLLTWRDPGSLAQLVSSLRPFYRATFAADPAARRPQRVEVGTSRHGVRITAPAALDVHAGRL